MKIIRTLNLNFVLQLMWTLLRRFYLITQRFQLMMRDDETSKFFLSQSIKYWRETDLFFSNYFSNDLSSDIWVEFNLLLSMNRQRSKQRENLACFNEKMLISHQQSIWIFALSGYSLGRSFVRPIVRCAAQGFYVYEHVSHLKFVFQSLKRKMKTWEAKISINMDINERWQMVIVSSLDHRFHFASFRFQMISLIFKEILRSDVCIDWEKRIEMKRTIQANRIVHHQHYLCVVHFLFSSLLSVVRSFTHSLSQFRQQSVHRSLSLSSLVRMCVNV